MKVTGHLFGYYYICKRKIWFASRMLNMEKESELVFLGKLLDETSYRREKHNFMVEDVASIDYLKKNTVYEVKRSDRQIDSAIAQVKFYLYHLYIRGLKNVKGQINFPLQKKTQEVTLSDKDIEEIPKIIREIEKIMSAEFPCEMVESKICKSCAYYDLCII